MGYFWFRRKLARVQMAMMRRIWRNCSPSVAAENLGQRASHLVRVLWFNTLGTEKPWSVPYYSLC